MPTVQELETALRLLSRQRTQASRLRYLLNESSTLLQLLCIKQIQRDSQIPPEQAILQLLQTALLRYSNDDSESAQALKLRLIENKSPEEAAEILHRSVSDLYRKQQTGYSALASLIYQMEESAALLWRDLPSSKIPTTVTTPLFGIDSHALMLHSMLTTESDPWILAVEGIGGIGKTALVDSLLRKTFSGGYWDGMAWVTAAPTILGFDGTLRHLSNTSTSDQILAELFSQLLPAHPKPVNYYAPDALRPLEHLLHNRKYLLVIDNLETVTDVEQLLPLIHRLINPSKVILTSRQSFYSDPRTMHFTVPELGAADAMRIIRSDASTRNTRHLLQAADTELMPIYGLIGGNPLALHLIAGQLHFHSLEVVLADLKHACGNGVENLYTYIYRRAWDVLDTYARQVLICMPLTIDRGGTIDMLTSITQMDRSQVRNCLDRLLVMNLVQTIPAEGRYTLHSLTRTFLLEQVLKWQSE